LETRGRIGNYKKDGKLGERLKTMRRVGTYKKDGKLGEG